jgi:hypothetical protein
MTNAPIQIKNPEVVRAIREVAALKGQPITQALGELARAELDRINVDEEARVQRKLAAIREAVDALHRLPRLAPPPTDDDFYDEDGLPR